MRLEAAPGEDRRVALALANSLHMAGGELADDLASVPALRAWLDTHGLRCAGRVGHDELAAVHRLRNAVRELLLACAEGRVPERASLETVNEAAAAAPASPRLVWSGPEPVAELDYRTAGGIELALGRLAADAIDLVAGSQREALLACAAPGCARLLLRSHPRRVWCSTRCGNRVRARRYYARRRSGASGRRTGATRSSRARRA